jgi:hypothetical protein
LNEFQQRPNPGKEDIYLIACNYVKLPPNEYLQYFSREDAFFDVEDAKNAKKEKILHLPVDR